MLYNHLILYLNLIFQLINQKIKIISIKIKYITIYYLKVYNFLI